MNRKMKSNPQVRTMSRGTKIFTYICLVWAVLVALMPLVWLFISSLKKDPLARPGFQLPESICLVRAVAGMNIVEYSIRFTSFFPLNSILATT